MPKPAAKRAAIPHGKASLSPLMSLASSSETGFFCFGVVDGVLEGATGADWGGACFWGWGAGLWGLGGLGLAGDGGELGAGLGEG